MAYAVSLAEMARQFSLDPLTPGVDISGISLRHAEINRPALQLAGFFDYFQSERLQIIGLVEYTYLEKMEPDTRRAALRKIFGFRMPCVVMCRGLRPMPEMLEYALEFGVPIFGTDDATTSFEGEIIRWLKVELAPRVTIHGVLVDIYGEGVLLMGESGIGKSETALELIKRGHRFVADDAVEIKRVSSQTLIGSCPEMIRYFIELRGIGIIDVKQMFGVESIKETVNIDLIIKLEAWEPDAEYERFGLTDERTELLGNRVTCHTIPIRPGRNLAVICECAAINHRHRKMGYNAALELDKRTKFGF
ncbi:MAG: HPr(Ser) kinase/phosphatase [Clostridiales bacterium]|jgi:HPr kinase/phosphorylase|nr:HPr(Ser) kinase/phosphatase [Clostridiales bacterium]